MNSGNSKPEKEQLLLLLKQNNLLCIASSPQGAKAQGNAAPNAEGTSHPSLPPRFEYTASEKGSGRTIPWHKSVLHQETMTVAAILLCKKNTQKQIEGHGEADYRKTL